MTVWCPRCGSDDLKWLDRNTYYCRECKYIDTINDEDYEELDFEVEKKE